MKVTAIIPDDVIKDVQKFSAGKNITESLIKALSDWLYVKRVQRLNEDLKNEPLNFIDGFSMESTREIR
jgi:hypothetical protein